MESINVDSNDGEYFYSGWSLCSRDGFLEYRTRSSTDRYDYMAYMATKDRSHAYIGILAIFYEQPGELGEKKVQVKLSEEFEDYLHPTEEEVTLFEMEREIPYIDEEILDVMRTNKGI